MSKIRRLAVPILLACSVATSFAKSYRAERYDVRLNVEKSGVLRVVETVVFQFSGGTFEYVYRDIATGETDGVTNVRASMDGRPLSEGSGPGQVEIDYGSPVKVKWNFGPLSDEAHTFTVEYSVNGAIRKEAGVDSLVWRVLPPKRKYRIAASEVVLEYPEGATLRTAGISGKRAAILFESGRAIARMSDIKSESRATIRAEFSQDSFASAKPAWMVRKEARGSNFAGGLRTAALAGLPLVAAAILLLFRMRGSEWSPSTGSSPGTVTRPPSELSPAMAARLTGSAHGSSGLLLDLARRGAVRIQELEKRRFGSRDFRILRAGGVRGLAEHEQRFVEVLFPSGEMDVPMSKAAPRIQSKWGSVSSAVNRELSAGGLLDEGKRRRRTRMSIAGVVGLALGLIVSGIGVKLSETDEAYLGGILVVTGMAVVITSLIAMIAAATISQWTATGSVVAEQWKAFRAYLKDLTKGRNPMPGPDAMEQFLPYAAAFGLAPALLKRQQEMGAVALPPWFAAFGSASDGSAVGAYIGFMTATSSGSSGMAGAGGGAGASGGGASGAG